jgi:hypothetical protein
MSRVDARSYIESPPCSNRSRSFVTPSKPSRIDSRDLDICPSWEFGSRFKDIARCRSRRESLIWSASRKSWLVFDMMRAYSSPVTFVAFLTFKVPRSRPANSISLLALLCNLYLPQSTSRERNERFGQMSSACPSILEIQSQATSKDTAGDTSHQRSATNTPHRRAVHIPCFSNFFVRTILSAQNDYLFVASNGKQLLGVIASKIISFSFPSITATDGFRKAEPIPPRAPGHSSFKDSTPRICLLITLQRSVQALLHKPI